jgi:hypothetical protein
MKQSFIQFNELGAKQAFGNLRMDWKVVDKILKEYYGEKLDKPVFITIDNRLRSKAAYHRIEKKVDERLPGMEPSFFNMAKEHGFYHFIKLNGGMLNEMNREGASHRDAEYWKMPEFYTDDVFKKYPLAAFVCHVIAHELQHSIQTDDRGDRKTPKLEYYEQALPKVDTFRSYWRKKKIELDAEEAARQIGPVLLMDYFETVGEPVEFNFSRKGSLYDDTNIKAAKEIHEMFKAVKPVKL